MFDKAEADAAFLREEYEHAAHLYHEGARDGASSSSASATLLRNISDSPRRILQSICRTV